MPNKNFARFPKKGPKLNKGDAGVKSVPDNVANWPGLPGKAQPRDRSNGVKKIRIHAKSEGI